MTTVEKKQKRAPRPGMQGFASLTAEKRSEIARLGGIAAHAQGRAHKWTSEEAAAAGRKGGSISRRRDKKGNA